MSTAIPASQLCRGLEGLFLIEDWENFGPDDDRTLMAWSCNFRTALARGRQSVRAQHSLSLLAARMVHIASGRSRVRASLPQL